jgi:AdoMet-dependent rRNA methyltransferase SPB1
MCRPILPVTKAEVEAEKARMRAVDARPIKKVAEAKGRQKRRAQARLSAAREKAEAVAAQVRCVCACLPTRPFMSWAQR